MMDPSGRDVVDDKKSRWGWVTLQPEGAEGALVVGR